jgi:signal peptidase I
MDNTAPPKGSWPRVFWAGLLSFVMPGVGHVYARAWRLGVALYLALLAFNALGVVLIWLLPPTPSTVFGLIAALFAYVIIDLIVAIDAMRRVRVARQRSAVPWYRSTWLAGIVVVIAQSVLMLGSPHGWQAFRASYGDEPTLQPYEIFMADMRHRGAEPAYGDLVVFQIPGFGRNAFFFKRIVGLPGDRVQMRHGYLYLNGAAVPREAKGPYLAPNSYGRQPTEYRETMPNGRSYRILQMPDADFGADTEEFTVPSRRVFALGDNRYDSRDSRYPEVGYVPIASIVGSARVIFISDDPSRQFTRVE